LRTVQASRTVRIPIDPAVRYNAGMRRDLCIAAGLIIATAAAYWPVSRSGFVEFDDPGYVRDNPHVRAGLTWDGVAWAFTTRQQSNWHPLTWLSHMLDCQLFGPAPGDDDPAALAAVARWHHLSNLALHIAAALALFAALRLMTGAVWRSAMVAALFALHPQHVESVAWISERKDVLSTLLGMLALVAYARYVRRPGVWRYLPVAALFALALLAKPMMVTLPLVMLLMDWWPLGRTKFQVSRSKFQVEEGGLPSPTLNSSLSAFHLVIEKLPLFALAAASCVVTYLAQASDSAMVFGRDLTPATRLVNAMVACATYVAKTLVPMDLALLYPYPPSRQWWEVAGAAAVVIAATAAAAWAARRRPYVTVGWLWFLVTLAPVIGIVQVGLQSMADRYTYVPLVGLFIAIVWGAGDAAALLPRGRWVAAAVGGAALAACGVMTMIQAGYWTDSVTLFERSIAVTEGNSVMHNNLGGVLWRAGQYDKAAAHFSEAVRINPAYAEARTGLAAALLGGGDAAGAAREYREALRTRPDMLDSMNALAWILATHPDPRVRSGAEAVGLAERAVELAATDEAALPVALDTLAAAYAEVGRFDDAADTVQMALDLVEATHAPAPVAAIRSHLELYRAKKPCRDLGFERI